MPDDDLRDASSGLENPEAKLVEPLLYWRLTEPAALLEEGWGRYPSTMDDHILFSATLCGSISEEFKGEVGLTVDGEEYKFSFDGKTLTAEIIDLKTGQHIIHLHAGSSVGIANRTFSFLVIDTPPTMQVGIGDDGRIYATLSIKMPPSQLGDISKWTCEKFSAGKSAIEVMSDNQTVAIALEKPLSMESDDWKPEDGSSPVIKFQSSMGEITRKLFIEKDESLRSGQTIPGCDQGSIYNHRSAGYCDPSLGWWVERYSFTSLDSEPRAIFNTEVPIPAMNWPPWLYPWRNCYNLIIVRYNSVREGSLNPLTHWSSQFDTKWHRDTPEPYFGVGYRDWAYRLYDRDHGYYAPSWCNYGWWSFEVDGNWCDYTIPAGFKSKGSYVFSANTTGQIFVDHTPPFFGDSLQNQNEGIDVILGSDIDSYGDIFITNLYNDLTSKGMLYKSNGVPVTSQQDFWQYCWNNAGQYMSADQLCLVVRAQDEPTPEGRYIDSFISMDYTYQGDNYADNNVAEHLFCVDVAPYYPNELSAQHWPMLVGGQVVSQRLPTDGDPAGEYSVWVMPVSCNLMLSGDVTSFRLRVKDDCNNWRRSEELIVEPEGAVSIACPENNPQYDDEVELTVEITGSEIYDNLEDNILWSVQSVVNEEWVTYGLNEDISHQYIASGYDSVIDPNEDWKGTSFTIQHFRDCNMRVQARLEACAVIVEDHCDLEIDADWEVSDIGFIVDDKHDLPNQTGMKWLVKNPCDNPVDGDDYPVQTRSGLGDIEIDYAVQVCTALPPVIADCALPQDIETIVSCSTDEDQEITVSLYRVIQASSRYAELDTLFGGAPQGQYAYYYARGSDVIAPPLNEACPLYVVDDVASRSSTEPYITPFLYISDRDFLLGDDIESTCYPDSLTQDYSIGICYEVDIQKNYKSHLDEMKYGSDRGRMLFDNVCDSTNETLTCYESDILTGGSEILTVTSDGDTANLGVQSRGDALFLICHGWTPNPVLPGTVPTGIPPAQAAYLFVQALVNQTCIKLGPFYGEDGSEDWIEPIELRNSYCDTEVDWLISQACNFLSPSSIPLWKGQLIDNNGPFEALCGFQIQNWRSNLPIEIWTGFSSRLTDNNCAPVNIEYWPQGGATCPAVIAWMENACSISRANAGMDVWQSESKY